MAISAEFTADFSKFTAAADGAKTALGGVTAEADKVDQSILKAGEALGRGFVDVGKQVIDSAKVFIEQSAQEEQATAKLVTALQNQGTATQTSIDAMGALATQFQNTTTYSDDMITSVEAVLVQVGNVLPSQMEAALTATTNLAAGLGISLDTAAKMVAKSIGSGGESLGKLKVILGETIKPGADAAQILQAINDKFGGQAAAQVDTYAGSMERLNNQVDDFKGKAGDMIVKALKPMLEAFNAMPDTLKTVIIGAGALITAFTPVAIAIGALTPAVTALAAALGITLVGALGAVSALLLPGAILLGGIAAVYLAFKHWDQITEFARQVYEGVKLWLVDKFTAIVGWVTDKINTIIAAFRNMMAVVVGGSYVPDMVSGIADEFRKLDRVMVRPAVDAAGAVSGAMGGLSGPALATAGGGGGAVTNTFYVNGTAEDVARTISAEIMRTMKAGAKVASS
jgi:hypothetical protein